MKNLSLNTLFLAVVLWLGLSSASLYAQQVEKRQYRCESIITYDAQEQTQILETFRYNESGELLQHCNLNTLHDYRHPNFQVTNTYDKSGHLTIKDSVPEKGVPYRVYYKYQNDSLVSVSTYIKCKTGLQVQSICTWKYNDKMQLMKMAEETFKIGSDSTSKRHFYQQTEYDERRNLISRSFTDMENPNKHDSKVEYAYDTLNHKIEETTFHRENWNWIPEQSIKDNYDSLGNLIEHNFYHWRNGEWLHVIKETRSYTKNGVIFNYAERKGISVTDDIACGDDGCHCFKEFEVPESTNNLTPWVEKKYKTRYTTSKEHETKPLDDKDIMYDNNGNILQELIYIIQNKKRVPYYKKEHTYDNFGYHTSCTQYDWKDGQWENARRSEWEYDANGNLICETSYRFVLQKWVKTSEVRKHWIAIQ